MLKQYTSVFLAGTFKMHLELLSKNYMIIRGKAKMLLKYRLFVKERLTKDTQTKEDNYLRKLHTAAFKHL